MSITAQRPVAVFDSGVGGLTVLKELVRLVPQADYLYFGDTARLPYGSKSVETVAKYTISSALVCAACLRLAPAAWPPSVFS